MTRAQFPNYQRSCTESAARIGFPNDVFAGAGRYNVNRDYTVNGLNQQTAAGSTSLSYDAAAMGEVVTVIEIDVGRRWVITPKEYVESIKNRSDLIAICRDIKIENFKIPFAVIVIRILTGWEFERADRFVKELWDLQ